MFADEPTGNLDSSAGRDVLALLRRAVDEFGQTIVMVTHDAGAAAVADRVAVPRRRADRRRPDRPDRGRDPRPDEGAAPHDRASRCAALAERKLRSALTAIAVLLGVAMIAGTYVLTDQISSGVRDLA